MMAAKALHVLFAVIWVGGMIFVQLALRPVVVAQLAPPAQAALMRAVLDRFFVLVWLAVLIIPLTGFWTIFAGYGGMSHLGAHIHYMTGIGSLMVLIYIGLFFFLFIPFKRALAAGQPERARALMTRLRLLIWVNLVLGVSVILVASGGA